MWQLFYLDELFEESIDRNELEFEIEMLVSAEEGFNDRDFRIQPKLQLVDIPA